MRTYTMTANFNIRDHTPFERAAYYIAMSICGLSAFYLLSVFITGCAWLPSAGINADLPALKLSLIQCLLGAAALHLPMLAAKFAYVRIPVPLCVSYYIFILCGTVLGEMFSLYYAIQHWDNLLHCGSGIMAGMLGSIVILNFFQRINFQNHIPPIFVASAAVCFALCIGVVWEIYEFTVDSLLGLNMQKFLSHDGSELIGQGALVDTMQDLIIDTFGALIAAAVSYISLKRKKGWLYNYQSDIITSNIRKQNLEKHAIPRSA